MPIVDPRFMAHQRRRLTRPDAYRYVRRGEPPAQSDIEAGWALSACRTEEKQRPSAGQGLRRLAEARCDLARLKTSLNAIRMRLAIGRSIAARKYSPDQPRVPAGEPGGGRWTDGGGAGDQADNNLQIATEAPRNDPRVISDASPEIIWTPARNMRGMCCPNQTLRLHRFMRQRIFRQALTSMKILRKQRRTNPTICGSMRRCVTRVRGITSSKAENMRISAILITG